MVTPTGAINPFIFRYLALANLGKHRTENRQKQDNWLTQKRVCEGRKIPNHGSMYLALLLGEPEPTASLYRDALGITGKGPLYV